jgi:hypothetical protein
MADLSSSLIWNKRWWWDPIDMEIFKELEDEVQQQVVAVSLRTQAQMLKIQAAGFEEMGNIIGGKAGD